ncbi:MAG: acetylxylan esterase [bacterium]|jgi:hypothetical protein
MKSLLFLSALFLCCAVSSFAAEEPYPLQTEPALDQCNDIRAYLIREAKELTRQSLSGIDSLNEWKSVRDERYAQFLEMMSLTDVPMEGERPPLNVKSIGTIQKDGYRIEKLYYESLPGLYVPANLYIPDHITQPVPAVLYVCGHSRTQKVSYQTHPRRWAELGFVALIIETIQWGEVYGHHWGCYSEGQFQWYSRGYTPGGVELWNSIRGLDLLCSLQEVDPERLGVTGISGGGAYSWYVAAADPRVKVAAPVCGTSTVLSHVYQRTIDGHCDCMMPINTYRIDVHDIGALIAPRPLLVASANRDGLNAIEAVRESYANIRKIYNLYGEEDHLKLVETPGGHSYHETSRTEIFSFFIKHLMGKDVPPDEVGDIDSSEENMLSAEELQVYIDGPPTDDRTTTIQDTFQKMAEPPAIKSEEERSQHRDTVVEFLKEKTFGAFPQNPPDLAIRREFRSMDGDGDGEQIFTYVPEEGFRLKLHCMWNENQQEKKPVLLVLKSPGEARWDSRGFSSRLPEGWTRAFLEVRGVGESSWAPELQWHVRRASAWSGRTIASMRVYDVLRAVQALREIPGVDGDAIAIAARDEMAVIALYAALLDGNLHTVLVQNPPETQNAPSAEDGRGEAIEMLNCLRITDVNQVAGLLYPTRVRFIQQPHETYNWAISMHKDLEHEDAMAVIGSIREWKP